MAADTNKEGGDYHLFGNLFLPDPRKSLPSGSLEMLRHFEPFIKDLGNRRQDTKQTSWSYQKAFESAVDAKVQLWQQRGIKRRHDFTVGPDGLLGATVACHLHCPSFSVKDPSSRKGADDSNVSIAQLLLAGFTPDRCLIYDHLFRREAFSGLQHYPPEILSVHERFTWDLRKNMGAVVDVCWGKRVKDRMIKELYLSQLPLWGQYKGVDLWLEWRHHQDSPGRPYLERFVLFVMHPEAMIYANKSTQGKLQDLHLSVAALLGNITINQHFYEMNHRRGTYGRLTNVSWAQQKELNKEAREQVLSCAKMTGMTTESLVYNSQPGNLGMFSLPQLSGNQLRSDTIEDDEVDKVPSEDELSVEEHRMDSAGVEEILPEVKKTVRGPQGLKCLITALVNTRQSLASSNESFDVSEAINDVIELLTLSNADEYSMFGDPSWEDIPYELRAWLEKQKGLRIDQRPMSTADDLLHSHQLLCRRTLGFESFSGVGIMRVLIDVAVRYYKQANPVQQPSKIAEYTIPGKHPVGRKCSACNSRVLDDAFPRYKKLEPSTYVLRVLKGGCGLQGCNPKGAATSVMALQVDGSMKFSRPDGNILKRPPREGDWKNVLIHSEESASQLRLPSTVECVCRICERHTNTDFNARWTIESVPRYLPSRPKCPICKKKDTNRRPLDKSIGYIDVAAVTKAWNKIRKQNYSIEEVLRTPDRYFPKPRQLEGDN